MRMTQMSSTSQNEHTGQLQKTGTNTEEYKENLDKVDWEWLRSQPSFEIKKKSIIPDGVRFP